jgi:beta-glucosidase
MRIKLTTLAVGFLLASMLTATAAAQTSPPSPPYQNRSLPVEERISDLLARMTVQERAAMLSGSGWMESQPNARLGIPAIKMADGPMGVRSWAGSSASTNNSATKGLATSFPAGIAMAATWNVDLVEKQARAVAQEVKALGRDMILGPTVNINRTPLWGRNFEGYGEDPWLTSRMAVAYIEGVQAEKVIPSIKHFAANNQEFERHRIDVKIDERALQEIYFPAFKAAIQEAGVWTVMSSYNKVNGRWAAENPMLLTDTLRKQWGFKGFVISDWGSTYSTAPTVNAGMNLEMPGGEPMRTWIVRPEVQKAGNGAGQLVAERVLAALADGKIKQDAIDDSVRRILRVMFTAGLFDTPHAGGGPVDTTDQRAVAREAATESIVLLKNEGSVLPLDSKQIRSLAVIGPSAAIARTGGGGSSLVQPLYAVSALEGIKAAAGAGVRVDYALGVSMQGEDPAAETPAERAKLRDEAVALARRADAAVVIVGYSSKLEAESFDRPSMDLPAGQDELIEAIAAANKKTAVVLIAGSPVTMTKWIGGVPAVLQAWYGGQEAGHAIGDIAFGVRNPSGKLPVTFPKQLADSPSYGFYPGEDLHVTYGEGIYVGYRGFDKKAVEPLFPFGHGLSYTRFDYTNLSVSPTKVSTDRSIKVSLRVRNSGTRAGAEVVQLYVRDVKSSVDRPLKELKGFRRVELSPGETKDVSFSLDRQALSFYSTASHRWVAEPGEFEVWVGASSRDIRLKGTFDLMQPPKAD